MGLAFQMLRRCVAHNDDKACTSELYGADSPGRRLAVWETVCGTIGMLLVFVCVCVDSTQDSKRVGVPVRSYEPASGAAGWPRRLLEWWRAQADDTEWLLRGRCGNHAHPTIAADRSATNYAQHWAARHEASEWRALVAHRAAWAKMATVYAARALARCSGTVARIRGDADAAA